MDLSGSLMFLYYCPELSRYSIGKDYWHEDMKYTE